MISSLIYVKILDSVTIFDFLKVAGYLDCAIHKGIKYSFNIRFNSPADYNSVGFQTSIWLSEMVMLVPPDIGCLAPSIFFGTKAIPVTAYAFQHYDSTRVWL